MNKIAGIVVALALSGCSSSSSSIRPTYVSPLQYQSYSCQQLAMEAQRVSARAAEAAGVQDDKASKDAVAMGVSMIIFWPALFFVSGGDGATAAELGRLRGEFEAIEKASVAKNCGINFQHR